MIWSDMTKAEKITGIKAHLEKGKTFKYISVELHTSPGAIQGFSHRNNIQNMNGHGGSKIQHKPRYKRGTKGVQTQPRRINQPYRPPDTAAANPSAFVPLPGSKPVTLMERTGCCWPVGSAEVQLFCDMNGGEYCRAHTFIRRSRDD